MDSLTAARAQMGLSLSFHMIFAAIGIGLPFLMVIAELLHLRTQKPHYLALTKKWAKAVGLLFAIGAISGTALAFEIGLLWPNYMKITGAVVGHLFGLEGLFFFIEAIFIGLYLYGWDKLSPRNHWLCGLTIAVSGGASGILILGVDSWMQQPLGFLWHNNAVTNVNPFAIFSSYAWVVMALHSTLSCYTAVSFAVAGIYAFAILRGKTNPYHLSALKIALAVGAVAALLQPLSGDALAKFSFHSQPAKFAAMEGQFKTQTYAPIRIGGVPDEQKMQTLHALEIPGGLSFLATFNPAAKVTGLEDIPRKNWPNVEVVHTAFQIMVGLGTFLALLSLWFWLAYWRKRNNILQSKWLLRAVLLASSFGFIALEAGWYVTESGRQPWAIQPNPDLHFPGLRTADAVTSASQISPIFFTFTLLYIVLAIVVIVLLRGIMDPNVAAPQQPHEHI